MYIAEVNYEQVFNTGNFTSQRVGAKAMLDEGDDPKEAWATLRTFVTDQDPARVEARAVLAAPVGHYTSEHRRRAYQTLGEPLPPELAAGDPRRPPAAEADPGTWPQGEDEAGAGGPF